MSPTGPATPRSGSARTTYSRLADLLADGAWRLVVCALLLCVPAHAAPDALDDAIAARDWPEVEALARDRLAEHPDDLRAHAELGRALLERARGFAGQTGLAAELAVSASDQAVEHLGRARELPGVHDRWLEARAEHPRPEPDLERALAMLADEGDPHAAYLWALRQPADADVEALERLEQALSARPQNEAYLLAALARRASLGRMGEARDTWERAAHAGASTEVLSAWSVALWPGADHAPARAERLAWLAEQRQLGADAWLGWYRAHALVEQGEREAALAVFEACREAAPTQVQRAHAALLLNLDRPQEAAELLTPLARAADWEAYEQLVSAADVLALARRFPAALELYDAALDVERRHERAQHHRALTLWRAGQPARAAAAFREVLERWPGRSDLLNDAGLAALGAGDRERAAALFEQAAALPQSRDAQENRAALGLASEDWSAARVLEWLDRVLAEEPQRSRALVLRARARSRG